MGLEDALEHAKLRDLVGLEGLGVVEHLSGGLPRWTSFTSRYTSVEPNHTMASRLSFSRTPSFPWPARRGAPSPLLSCEILRLASTSARRNADPITGTLRGGRTRARRRAPGPQLHHPAEGVRTSKAGSVSSQHRFRAVALPELRPARTVVGPEEEGAGALLERLHEVQAPLLRDSTPSS